jgi:phosphoglycolate phosphatase-like HAD superfamily hydrolase
MKDLVIFDIDGVLLDSSHRIKLFIDKQHEQYFAKAFMDMPIPQGLAVCDMFLVNPAYRVLFVTGRGDTSGHREDTLISLNEYLDSYVASSQLLMREWPEVGEHLHDAQKKPLMIEQAGYSLDDIFMVFEDRNSVVEMWRKRGITVYHTQDGPF